MHIHLDLLGGLAGDMFLAAALDAGLVEIAPLTEALRTLGLAAAARAAAQAPSATTRTVAAARPASDASSAPSITASSRARVGSCSAIMCMP